MTSDQGYIYDCRAWNLTRNLWNLPVFLNIWWHFHFTLSHLVYFFYFLHILKFLISLLPPCHYHEITKYLSCLIQVSILLLRTSRSLPQRWHTFALDQANWGKPRWWRTRLIAILYKFVQGRMWSWLLLSINTPRTATKLSTTTTSTAPTTGNSTLEKKFFFWISITYKIIKYKQCIHKKLNKINYETELTWSSDMDDLLLESSWPIFSSAFSEQDLNFVSTKALSSLSFFFFLVLPPALVMLSLWQGWSDRNSGSAKEKKM